MKKIGSIFCRKRRLTVWYTRAVRAAIATRTGISVTKAPQLATSFTQAAAAYAKSHGGHINSYDKHAFKIPEPHFSLTLARGLKKALLQFQAQYDQWWDAFGRQWAQPWLPSGVMF